MRLFIAILIAIVAMPSLVMAEEEVATTQPTAEAATTQPTEYAIPAEKDRISYALGISIGSSLRGQMMIKPDDLNLEYLMKGLTDFMNDQPLVLEDEQIRESLMALQMKIMQRQQQLQQLQQQMQQQQQAQADPELAAKNLAEGQAFLADNASKEGVVTTDSGLQYKVIEEGTGETPGPESTVTTHYRGTLIDETEFDSSYNRGEPISFPVNGVIAGWTEALQMMKVGSKWRLFIPADLAYGERGNPPVIGPNSVLIFDIELVGVENGGEE